MSPNHLSKVPTNTSLPAFRLRHLSPFTLLVFLLCSALLPHASAVEPAIAAGETYALFLKTDGSVWATGSNLDGELGDNTYQSRSEPVQIMSDAIAISARNHQSLFLKSDHTAWIAGLKSTMAAPGEGELLQFMPDVISISADARGPMTITSDYNSWTTQFAKPDSTSPWIISHTPILSDVIHTWAQPQISVYSKPLCLKSDHTLWRDTGSGYETYLSDIENVVTSELIPCYFYLKTDGTLWAEGIAPYGQRGDYSTEELSTPTMVMSDVQAVATGNAHSLFLKTDGSVWSVGNNSNGQLGTGTTTNSMNPVMVMTHVKAVATGLACSYFLKEDNTVWGCGDSSWGQLGIDKNQNPLTPVFLINLDSSSTDYVDTDHDGVPDLVESYLADFGMDPSTDSTTAINHFESLKLAAANNSLFTEENIADLVLDRPSITSSSDGKLTISQHLDKLSATGTTTSVEGFEINYELPSSSAQKEFYRIKGQSGIRQSSGGGTGIVVISTPGGSTGGEVVVSPSSF